MKKAFTLAETLITLGIIGVVAALTLPNLVQNYKKQVVATKLQKAYAVIKAAENMAIKEFGDINTWEFVSNSSTEKNKFFNTYYLPFIKTVPCKSPNLRNDPVTGQAEYVYNDTKEITYYLIDSVCLADGTRLSGGQMTLNYNLIGKIIVVDINGYKKPNIVGKDIFGVFLSKPIKTGTENYQDWSYYIAPKCPISMNFCVIGTQHGSKGFYWDGDEETLIKACKSPKNSLDSCGYIIQQAGWKVPDNYPIKL